MNDSMLIWSREPHQDDQNQSRGFFKSGTYNLEEIKFSTSFVLKNTMIYCIILPFAYWEVV